MVVRRRAVYDQVSQRGAEVRITERCGPKLRLQQKPSPGRPYVSNCQGLAPAQRLFYRPVPLKRVRQLQVRVKSNNGSIVGGRDAGWWQCNLRRRKRKRHIGYRAAQANTDAQVTIRGVGITQVVEDTNASTYHGFPSRRLPQLVGQPHPRCK